MKKFFLFCLLILFTVFLYQEYALVSSNLTFLRLITNIGSFFQEFFPPDISIISELLVPLLETFRMSFVATFFSALLSLPLALFTSHYVVGKNVAWFFKIIIVFFRSIPALIWALFFVVCVGPGSLAGILGLTFYGISYLSKFFADTLEANSKQEWLYLMRRGVGPIKAFRFSLFPEIKAHYAGHILWMLEYNIRSASILGLVGAGGIGMKIYVYQEYGQWQKFSMVIILIFFISLITEFLGKKIRQKD